jgi:hypothetical protein
MADVTAELERALDFCDRPDLGDPKRALRTAIVALADHDRQVIAEVEEALTSVEAATAFTDAVPPIWQGLSTVDAISGLRKALAAAVASLNLKGGTDA